jgi:hypothetical protein
MNTVTTHTTKKFEDYINTVAPTPEAWAWYVGTPDADVHIFEDTQLPTHTQYDGKKKVALVAEVPAIYDNARLSHTGLFHPYEWLKDNHQHFDHIMSPFLVLKDLVGEAKFTWVPCQDCFIDRNDFGLYEKERLLSAIASFKTWTDGHRMRHAIINRFHDKMDVYGSGYNDIINKQGNFGKVIALAPYCFTIVVPNTKVDDFFSEQLTDALVLGTIPIYRGTDGVKKHFNMDGIIQFETVDELEGIINGLSFDLYKSKMDAVVDNFNRAKEYTGTVNWLFKYQKALLENL